MTFRSSCIYVLWLYQKADVISTLGSHNSLIPRHGWYPIQSVIFRTLRILMSMMIDLFIQWREIFILTMPSDQTTPRAADFQIFFFLVGHNKGRDITVRAYYKVSEKKDDEQGDIIRGAALICFWPSSKSKWTARGHFIRLGSADSNRFFFIFKFPWGGSLSVVHLQTSARWTITPDCSFEVKGLIDCSVHIS